MLNGELLLLLKAAQYLIKQIAINGKNFDANLGDIAAIGIPYTLPLTLDELLALVEDDIKEVYLKIQKLIGDEYWDSIIEEYDNTLTRYLSKEYKKPPVLKRRF